MGKATFLGLLGLAMVVAGITRVSAGKAVPASIAYVDVENMLRNTKAGKGVRDALEAEKKKRQTEINKKQDALKAKAESLEKRRLVLKEDALQKAQEELQKEYIDLQNRFMQLQQDLSKKEEELTRTLLGKATKAIEEIARRDGYTMVFAKTGGVLWATSSIDITAELNRKLDATP